MYFEQTSCFILDSQIINRLISSITKWHSLCFKMVKKSGRYLLLYESNKDFKVASYFSITLQITQISTLLVGYQNYELKTFGEILKKQFETQKEFYVTPTIIILSALSQAIFTFSFACTQLNDLQRHILLCSYILLFVPQVLSFILYVLPSTSYKSEFFKTLLSKNSVKWMLTKKKNKTIILKMKTYTSK